MIENMTNEQAAECLKTIHVLSFKDETATFFLTDVQNAFKLAIKALEQIELNPSYNGVKTELESCEDCISRQAIKEMLTEEWTKYMPMEMDVNLSFVLEKISELPSVTPKSENSWKEIKIKFECDDCISRQAVLDLTGKSDWFESSDDYNDFVCAVCNLPSVKPTRPKGVWLKRNYWSEGIGMGETYGYYYQCSECKNKVKGGNESCNAKFCSNCGAQMGGSK